MTASIDQRLNAASLSWRNYGRHRYSVLFYSLLLMMVVTPIANSLGFPHAVIRITLGFVLVAAVMPNQTRRNRYILLAAILAVIALGFASDDEDVPISSSAMAGLTGVIGLLCAAGALRAVVTAARVDHEVIYAALSTYLLAGIFFAQIHLAVEGFAPGSYSGPTPLSEASAIYFSFVTLATLGYGDYLPTSDLARGLTVFEVIGGQLYLAVMIARLIGMFPGAKRES